MKKVKLIQPATMEGSEIVDVEIELSDLSADALVAEGRAVYVPGSDEKAPSDAKDAEGDQADTKEATDAQEALQLQKKAINDKYKRDELATAAKDLGVEFAYDAKKDEIIDAVIAADKATVLIG